MEYGGFSSLSLGASHNAHDKYDCNISMYVKVAVQQMSSTWSPTRHLMLCNLLLMVLQAQLCYHLYAVSCMQSLVCKHMVTVICLRTHVCNDICEFTCMQSHVCKHMIVVMRVQTHGCSCMYATHMSAITCLPRLVARTGL